MERIDGLVLDAIAERILAPEVIERAIVLAAAKLQPTLEALDVEAATLKQQRTVVEMELLRLGQAIANGGELASLVAAIRDRELVRAQIVEREALLSRRGKGGAGADGSLLTTLKARAADWRVLLRGHIPQARQIVKKLISQPFRLEVRDDDQAALVGAASPANLFGSEWAFVVASPTIPSWNQIAAFLESMRVLRDSSGLSA